MIQAFQNIWNVPELKKRIGFMLGLLAVYRVGAFIPIPFINLEKWQQFLDQAACDHPNLEFARSDGDYLMSHYYCTDCGDLFSIH